MSQKPTWRERLNYRFDNALAKGPLVLIGWLAIAAIILVLLATLFSLVIPGVAPEGTGSKEVFWDFLFQALTPNPFDVTSPLPFLLIMLVVTLASLFMVSILIGTLTTGIEERLEHLRRGRSKVLENEHTVILGWSHQVFTIITEIITANENRKNGAVIAILADRDKVDMEHDIRERVPDTKNTRIICRSGRPNDTTDIEIISPHTARSILILPPEEGDPDSYVIKTALALLNNPRRRAERYHIVTEIQQPHNLDVIRMIGEKDDLHAILTGDVVARVTAQTSRQSGLSVVYTELLNFGGDEIYFKEEPSLSGRVFGDVLNSYADSSVIGIQQLAGGIRLNPPMETRIAPGDKIIAISADDDTIRLSGHASPPVQIDMIHSGPMRDAPEPEKGLIIGWNGTAATIIEELDSYVAKGSSLTVLADAKWQHAVKDGIKLINQKVVFRPGDTILRAELDEINVADFDHVIVLADTTLDPQDADSRTLITLLHMRNIAEKDETPFSIVSEMLDMRNRELAEVTRVDDFIVSDHLISLMMAQISENGDLFDVFNDLFDPQGSEIYLKSAADYVATGQPVTFYTVVEAARRRGEVAIGYRVAGELRDAGKSYGVYTNPIKSKEINFAQGDKVIVLAED
jgi:voltage-gated potassium channel Kch